MIYGSSRYQRDFVYILAIGFISFGFGLTEYNNHTLKNKVIVQEITISGQDATIAAYKENLTSCLKDSKVATQDEFTGE